jgi:hypothetical protein
MSSETYQILARTLCMRYPLTPVHCRADRAVVPHSIPLNRQAVFFDYIIINGKRYYGSRTVGSNRSSFVHVIIPQRTGQIPLQLHGEVLEIFQIDQDIQGLGESLWFARMRWFKPWQGEHEEIWNDL